MLRVLARLNNADKHRSLVVMAPGITDCVAEVFYRGDLAFTQPQEVHGIVEDSTEVANFGIGDMTIPNESDVQVKIRGTPVVAVEVVNDRGCVPLPAALNDIVDQVKNLLAAIEPFARANPAGTPTVTPASTRSA